MQPLDIGLMFWAGKDPRETLREIKALGIHCGQLGIPGDMPLAGAADAWREALEEEEFELTTVFAAFAGEEYTNIPTVLRTVGFIPPYTRADREGRMMGVGAFAGMLGVPSIACHIGLIPEDRMHPDYMEVRDLVQRVCDHAMLNDQTFALETGQEPAHALRLFIEDVDRPNLRINFDPANMILYGTGDPIEALGVLGDLVVSVHCKDGDWPPKGVLGALGTEQPLGQGAVGIERFLAKLKEIGYRGSLNIEREVENQAQRRADIRLAVELLKRLR